MDADPPAYGVNIAGRITARGFARRRARALIDAGNRGAGHNQVASQTEWNTTVRKRAEAKQRVTRWKKWEEDLIAA